MPKNFETIDQASAPSAFQNTLQYMQDDVGKTEDQLHSELNKIAEEIQKIFRSVNTLDVLANCILAELSFDTLTYKETESHSLAAAVEYLSMLSLKQPYCTAQSDPLEIADSAAKARSLAHSALYKTISLNFLRCRSDETLSRAAAGLRYRTLVYETFVRSPAYPIHSKAILSEILADSEDLCRKALGFTLSEAISVLDALAQVSQINVNRRIESAQSEFDQMEETIRNQNRSSQCDVEELLDDAQTRVLARHLSGLSDVFTVSISEVVEHTSLKDECVKKILESFLLGSHEIPPDFYLPSPFSLAYQRPVIKWNERYFLAQYDFLSTMLYRVEELFKVAEVFNGYEKRRKNYTESKTAKIFQKMLPTAEVFEGCYYRTEGGLCELDTLILFDTTILLIEVKAGQLHSSTRRGSASRAKKDLGELLNKADRQSARAQKFIEESETPIFRLTNGKEIRIDRQRYRNIERVAVSLVPLDVYAPTVAMTAEVFGFSGEQHPWSVCLTDLMVIEELLQFPAQLMHYLRRRRRINELKSIQTNDELDFFAAYLRQGLWFEDESPEEQLFILSETTELDTFYFHKMGKYPFPVKKPRMEFPPFISALIEELCHHNGNGWSEVICRVLDLSSKAWETLENLVTQIRAKTSDDHRIHFSAMQLGVTGISVITVPTENDGFAETPLYSYVERCMTRTDASTWVGLAFAECGDRLLLSSCFLARSS